MLQPLLTSILIAVPVAPEKDLPAIALPKEPDVVVIEFAYKGGFTPPRKNNDPNMSVTADGTVRVSDPFTGATARIKIDQKELQRILSYVIRDQKFLEFDAAKVAQAVRDEEAKRGGIPRIADAASTHVTIKTAEKSNSASYYALSFQASQFKTIDALQQLLAVEQRLSRLHSLAWAGGEKALESFLAKANAELKKTFPDVEPLTKDDLQHARKSKNLVVTFNRTGDDPANNLSVSMSQDDDGEPTITSISRGMTPAEYDTWAKNKEAFAELLDTVNAEVKKKFPTFGTLSKDDLQSLRWNSGAIAASFRREGKAQGEFVFAYLQKPEQGETTVRVSGRVK